MWILMTISKKSQHHLGMGLGSSKWKAKPRPLPCQAIATPPPLPTATVIIVERKRRGQLGNFLVGADMFWVLYKHYLTKSSQKAPKGNKYYYSHFIGKETEIQNCHICFPRSAASGQKNQDSNPYLRATSTACILFNSLGHLPRRKSRKGFIRIRAWGVRDIIFSSSCQGLKKKQRTGLFPFQRRSFLKGLPGSLLLVPHPGFLSDGGSPPPAAVSLHWQQQTAAHRPLRWHWGRANSVLDSSSRAPQCDTNLPPAPFLCPIRLPSLPSQPLISHGHWNRNPCLRLCIWRTKPKLRPSPAPVTRGSWTRTSASPPQRQEKQGKGNWGTWGPRDGGRHEARQLTEGSQAGSAPRPHASLPSALCTLGN